MHYGLIGAGAKGAGLASTLRFMTSYLSDAYVERRGFQFAGRLNYAGDAKSCRFRYLNMLSENSYIKVGGSLHAAGTRTCKKTSAVGDVECFFRPMSNCTVQRAAAFHKYAVQRCNKFANRNATVWHGATEWSFNEGQIPNSRGVRVVLGTGYSPIRGTGWAWRNGEGLG